MNFIIRKLRRYKLRNFIIFNKEQAKKWAIEKYRNIDIDKDIYRVIAKYCKENEPKVNFALRNNKKNNEIINEIRVLDEFLEKYSLDENIVVFRLLNFNPFKNSNIFTEKGFMSTSIVNGDINAIHRHDYRLKIYLPIGTKGFYVNFISSRESENEFLLPRKTTIYYLNDYMAEDGRNEIECYVKINK